ncbi:hypothetical protein KSF78_0008982 [Schistosoma japonicum]|nr:hypothetical protein KSF78_0008982 [Schistosoma japonicum]
MKLRLKFLNKFHVFETTSVDSTLFDIFEFASKAFGLRRNNVQISLNAKDYYDSNCSHQRISELGIVNGDIIYVRSLEKLDDIRQSLEAELAIPIFRLAGDLISSQQYSPVYFMAIPLYIFATDKGLNSLDNISQYYQRVSSIMRLTFAYPEVDSTKVVFTLFQNGNMTSIAASVQNLPIRKQLILKTKYYLINQEFIDQSIANKLNLLYRRLRLLSIRIKDELIEPILLALHSEFNLHPRIHLCNLPNELLYEILSYLPLSSLGCLMFCNHELYNRIRNCNMIWRIQLAKLDAKKKPILYAALSRQQQCEEGEQSQKHCTLNNNQQNTTELNILVNDGIVTSFNTSSISSLTSTDSDCPLTNDQIKEDEAYERFLARHKSLSIQRR